MSASEAYRWEVEVQKGENPPAIHRFRTKPEAELYVLFARECGFRTHSSKLDPTIPDPKRREDAKLLATAGLMGLTVYGLSQMGALDAMTHGTASSLLGFASPAAPVADPPASNSLAAPAVTDDPQGAPPGSIWFRDDLGLLRYESGLFGVLSVAPLDPTYGTVWANPDRLSLYSLDFLMTGVGKVPLLSGDAGGRLVLDRTNAMGVYTYHNVLDDRSGNMAALGTMTATSYYGELDTAKLGAEPFSFGTFASGQVLYFNGTDWTNMALGSASVTSINGLVGAVSIVQGNGIGIVTSSPDITVSAVINGTTLLLGASGLSVNLANANTWSAVQTFPASSLTNAELAGPVVTGLTTTTAVGLTLTAAGSGVGAYSYTPSVTFGKDISGTSFSLMTVVGIQGIPVVLTTLASGQVLQYNGTDWVNVSPSSVAVTSINGLTGAVTVQAGTGIGVSTVSPDITITNTGVLSLQGQTGALTLTAGNGISISTLTIGAQLNGTTLLNGSLGLSLNLANANTWTAIQTFPGASLTNAELAGPVATGLTTVTGAGITLTAGGTGVGAYSYTPSLTLGGDLSGSSVASVTVTGIRGVSVVLTTLTTGDIIQYNGTDWVNVLPSGLGLVDSVSNSDGTLTVSPTTGAVAVSLALGHANTWTGVQTFPNASLTNAELAGPVVTGLTTASGAGITLTASGGGVGPYAYTPSISGNLLVGAFGVVFSAIADASTAGKLFLSSTTANDLKFYDTQTTPALHVLVDSLNIGSYAVTGIVGGTAISIAGTTGAITITNTGVTSAVAGTGIAVSAATGAVTISLSGNFVTSLTTETGAGITLTATNPTGLGAGYYTPSVSIGGDLSGSSLSLLMVAKLQTYTLTLTAPSTNQVLVWNGLAWVNAAVPSTAGVTSLNGLTGALTIAAGNAGISVAVSSPDIDISLAELDVGTLGGKAFSFGVLAAGDFLYYNGTDWANQTLVAGTAISISGATITNTGVTSLVAGTGIAVSGATGAVTVSASAVPNSSLAGPLVSSLTAGANAVVTNPVGVGAATVGVVASPAFTDVTLSGTLTVTDIGQVGGVVYSATAQSIFILSTYTTAGALQTALEIDGLAITTGVWQATPIANAYLAGPLVTSLTTETSAGITLTASGTGVGAYYYTPSVTLGGDLSGTSLSAATLAKIQGVVLSVASLVSGDILQYNGTDWVNVALGTAGVTSLNGLVGTVTIAAGNVGVSVSVSGQNIDISLAELDVGTLAAKPFLFGTLVSGNLLEYNGTDWVNAPLVAGAGILVGGLTISNTGVLSLQGSAGALTLVAGTGIGISSLTITNTGVTSLAAGTNISVSSAAGAVTVGVVNAPTFSGLVTMEGGAVLPGPASSSVTTVENSPTLDLLGSYWNGTASVPYGSRVYWIQDSTVPAGHLSFNLDNDGTITEVFALNSSGVVTKGTWEATAVANAYLVGPLVDSVSVVASGGITQSVSNPVGVGGAILTLGLSAVPDASLAGPLVSSLTTESGGGITLTATSPPGVGAGYYTPSVSIGGDLSGSSLVSLTVAKLQTYTLTLTTPAANQVLVYNGTSWVNASVPATAGVTSLNGLTGALVVQAGNAGISVTTSSPDIDISLAELDVGTLAAKSFLFGTLIAGDVLEYNGTDWVNLPLSAGAGISVSALTITNTGVTSLTAGTGMSLSGSAGAVTVSLSGNFVTSLTTETGAGITLTATNPTGLGAAYYVPSVSLGGDISGSSLGAVTVAGIRGVPVVITTLTTGQILQYNGTDWVNVAIPSAPVSSVSNTDGTLTISPTTGAVIASLALGHANTWTGIQSFPAASLTNTELAGPLVTGMSTASGAGITLTAAGSGVGLYTYTPSITGNLQVGAFGVVVSAIADLSTAGLLFLSSTTVNTLKFYDTQATPALHVLLDSLNIGSYAVTGLVGGSGISIAGTTGSVTVTNSGVLSLQGSVGALTLTAGAGIGITGLTITNSGVTSLASANSGITVSASTGAVTLTLGELDQGTLAAKAITITTLTTGNILQYNGTAWVNAALPAAPVSSVSNSDGTLTISPTTGAVVASLALGHANTWTAIQTFPGASLTNAELGGPLVTGLTTTSGAGITLTAAGSGVGAYTYTPSITGNLLVGGFGAVFSAIVDASTAGKLFLSSTTANTLKFYDTQATPALHALIDSVNVGSYAVTDIVAGAGVSVSGVTGGVTVTNTGIISLSAGTGISVSGTNPATIANTGVTTLAAGNVGISVSASTGSVSLSLAELDVGTLDGKAFLFGTLAAGEVLTYNGTDWVNAAIPSAPVSSVSNSDGTLTISPTTGAVVASLALGHANAWSALQTFDVGVALVAIVDSSAAGKLFLSSTTANALKYYDTQATPVLHELVVLDIAQTFSALQTFGGGITGTGNTGTLTAGSGVLGTANTWTAAQTFGAGITGTGSVGTLTVPWGNLTGVPSLVNSFDGRTGAVVPASGDYSFSLISGTATNAQLAGPVVTGLTTVSGVGITLTAGGTGVGAYSYTPSITGNLDVGGFGLVFAAIADLSTAGLLFLSSTTANTLKFYDTQATPALHVLMDSLNVGSYAVTGLVGGTAISISGGTGSVTVTNTGVTSLVAGTGIAVSGATGGVTVSLSGNFVTSLTTETAAGITLTATDPSGLGAAYYTPSVGLGGDVSGSSLGAVTVAGIRGVSVVITTLTAGQVLQYNGTDWVNVTLTTAPVSSVSNSDGTLTISPTTGAVVASLNLGHANTWSAVQTFGNDISFGGAALNVVTLATGQFLYYNGTDWVNQGLGAGTGIGISDYTITNTGIISLSAGTGISVSGTNPATISLSGNFISSLTTESGAGITLTATNPTGVGAAYYVPSITGNLGVGGFGVLFTAIADASVAGKLFLSSTTANTLKFYDTQATPLLHSIVDGLNVGSFAVTGIVAGTGIGVSGATGSVTVSNTGALSFNGRTGAVSPASGDYSFSLISGTATNSQLAGPLVTGLVTESGAGITLTAGGSGVGSYSYTPSITGNLVVGSHGVVFSAMVDASVAGNLFLSSTTANTMKFYDTQATPALHALLDSLNVGSYAVTGLVGGTGVSISGSTGSVTVTNTGIISLSAGGGISVSGTDPATITNTGVTSAVAGTGIAVSGATGAVTFSLSGNFVSSLTTESGVGITLTATNPSGIGAAYYVPSITGNLGLGGFGIQFTGIADVSTSGLLYLSSTTANTLKFYDTQATPALHVLLDSLNIGSYAVTGLTGGTGISIAGVTGAVTVTNTGVTSLAAGNAGVTVSVSTGAVSISLAELDVGTIAGKAISIVSLISGQALVYNGTDWVNEVIVAGTYVASLNGLTGALSVTSPNATLNVGTSGSDVTVDINLGNANTWSGTQTFTSRPVTNGLLVDVAGGGGPTQQLQLFDTTSGAATPYKGFRVSAGSLQVTNSAFTAVLLTLGDTGALTTVKNTLDDGSGNMTATGTLGLPLNSTGLIGLAGNTTYASVAIGIIMSSSNSILLSHTGATETTQVGPSSASAYVKFYNQIQGVSGGSRMGWVDSNVSNALMMTLYTAAVTIATGYTLSVHLVSNTSDIRLKPDFQTYATDPLDELRAVRFGMHSQWSDGDGSVYEMGVFRAAVAANSLPPGVTEVSAQGYYHVIHPYYEHWLTGVAKATLSEVDSLKERVVQLETEVAHLRRKSSKSTKSRTKRKT